MLDGTLVRLAFSEKIWILENSDDADAINDLVDEYYEDAAEAHIIEYLSEHHFSNVASNRHSARIVLGIASDNDIRAEIAHYRRLIKATKCGSPQVARAATSMIRQLEKKIENTGDTYTKRVILY